MQSFKTNIKCNGCIQKVKPYLDDLKGIKSWEVDLTSQDRILSVEGDGIEPAGVISALKQAGYQAERI